MANNTLLNAKMTKNDEFYTQYDDIQREVNAYLEYDPDTFKDKTVLLPCDDPEWSNFTKFFAQNFEMLGLKKLISTSYATSSKNKNRDGYQFTLDDFLTDFEKDSSGYNQDISMNRGKLFTLTRRNKKVDIDDLNWKYLEGDGDFKSDEVTALRDEADIIITNPPFSLFREFIAWIMEADKKFLIIGSQGAAGYKEVFPYIKNNKIWLGNGFAKGNAYFKIPAVFKTNYAKGVYDTETGLVKFRNCAWFTNLDHGRRHEPLRLMSMMDNLKYSKHKDLKENGYYSYYNYNAIDIPYTDAIPGDYEGVMGVPISFLDKYNPEQFEIIGLGSGYLGQSIGVSGILKEHKKMMKGHSAAGDLYYIQKDGTPKVPYARVLIKKREGI